MFGEKWLKIWLKDQENGTKKSNWRNWWRKKKNPSADPADSPLVAVIYSEVANVAADAVISHLMLVNDAAVSEDAAVAFISHVTLVNDAAFGIVMLLQLKL